MTTISFDESLDIPKLHFKSLEDFQLYIVQKLQGAALSTSHKSILDARLQDAKDKPDDYVTFDELKSTLKRQ